MFTYWYVDTIQIPVTADGADNLALHIQDTRIHHTLVSLEKKKILCGLKCAGHAE